MRYAPDFGSLLHAHRYPRGGNALTPRHVQPQTLVVSSWFHLYAAPAYTTKDGESRLIYTAEELCDRIGLLPSTIKTALKRCHEDGVLLVEKTDIKDHFAISTLWPPTPKGGAS